MLRRLAVLLVMVPLMAACGQRPLLSVGIQRLVVQPNASLDTVPEDIPYAIGAPAHVNITLVEPDGQSLVLRDNDRAPDSYAIPFGGIVDVPNTQDRRVLQNGDYKIVFQARGKDGQAVERSVDAVVQNADPVPLDIKDISLSLPVFEPNGQGVRQVNGRLENLDQTVIDYSLSKDASVSLWAADKDGNQTAITADPKAKAGLQSITWQGKGADGIALKDGTYTLHIKAEDASGNVTEKTTSVTIKNSGTPQVQVISAHFLPGALGIGGTVQVEVTVKNIGDVAIRTQGPPPGTVFKSNMRYTDPSFNRPGDAEPPYVDKPGIWRVAVDWTSSAGNYPARWGFFQDDSRMLQPGEEVTVRGGVQLLAPQPNDLYFVATVEMGGVGFEDQFGRTHVVVGH
ncbi:MAG TPA: FlgD immunoglobulin-like domain containing protein [Chloroflexota bacterium]|nr:FlgD immunoglobulin-like domain containing protein [Chloroflexota bacterium]